MCRPLGRQPPTLQTRTLPAGKPALWPCRTEKTMSCEWLGTSAPQPVIFGLSRTLNRVTRHSQEGHIVPQAMRADGLCHERRQSPTRLCNRSTDDSIDTEPCQRFIEPVKKHEFFARTTGNKRF